VTADERTVAIVQARMGSARLPGKVLKDIAGETMLARVLERLSEAETLDEIVVATSDLERDDPIKKKTAELGFPVTRGAEEDVLDRYHQAAREHDADVIVRVTSDCPLIDPGIVDEIVERFLAEPEVDYCSNTLEPRTYPRGMDVEVFSRQALEKAWDQDDDIAAREHVTPFMRSNPNLFQHERMALSDDLSRYRLTVDEKPDLEVARAVARHFDERTPSLQEVVDFLERNPDVVAMNDHIQQKEVANHS